MIEVNADALIRAIIEHHPETNTALIREAFDYAKAAHEGQKRFSGEPYFNHVFATALRLATWRMPQNIVIAGILHDVKEDAGKTPEEIEKLFGGEVASMIIRVTKLGKVQYRGMERYVENLRKMFLAIAEDVRAIFIKFADRLNNLEDLYNVPDVAKRKRIALESLEIYAPIANRLGMGVIRRELEDRSFQYVYPKEYEWVAGLMKERYAVLEPYLETIKNAILDDLRAANIHVLDIHARTKGLYSLYKKLTSHERDINKIYDIVACRIVVPDVGDCYNALGVIHARWKPLKGRIKDYIAQPKPNGYQSLHTTIFGENGQIIEVQIRSETMHEQAEYGLAAHWFYKEQGKSSPFEKKYIVWLKELGELQKEMSDKAKFAETLESLKIDIFQNRIFVFTPKGDVIDLPEGATPVDFAYAIHTDLGNTCAVAKVNGQIVKLDVPLLSSDVVEIIPDKKRKSPSAAWLKFVKTRQAREKIREQIRKTRLGEFILRVAPPKINGKKFH